MVFNIVSDFAFNKVCSLPQSCHPVAFRLNRCSVLSALISAHLNPLGSGKDLFKESEHMQIPLCSST